jgi:thymidylate synthase
MIDSYNSYGDDFLANRNRDEGESEEDYEKELRRVILDSGCPTRYLSCQMYQRSADLFLGVPFNIASYALLTIMMAKVTNHAPRDYIHTFGNAHIYTTHFKQVEEMMGRNPPPLPFVEVTMDQGMFIGDATADQIRLHNYNPLPAIKAPVAV